MIKLKKFASYYGMHKGLFILDMVFAFFQAGLNLLVPFIVKVYIDNAIPNQNTALMLNLAVVLVVTLILSAVSTFIVSYFGHVMGTKIERDMRSDLFAHFQKMDSQFFASEKVGRLMSRLVGDLRDISEFSHHGPEDLFISSIMLLGSFVILANIDLYLTLILFALLIAMVIFTISRRKRMSVAFARNRSVQAELNGQIENSLSGISVMKSYTNESFELERFKNSNATYQKSWTKAYFEMGIFASTMDFTITLMTTAVLITGGYFAVTNRLSVGDLAAFILYITYFTSPIRRLIGFFDQFQNGWSGFTRFYNMLQVDALIKSGHHKFKTLTSDIVFKDVLFMYEDTPILKDFNLEIKLGTSVAIVGKTGAGKSTIAKLLPRFYDVNEGAILLNGLDIKEYDLTSLRSEIGYVEQDSYIFFGTILDNILYGDIDATYEQVIQAAKMASLDEFVQTLPDKYDTQVGDKGIKLSGGQKQRISLARMFLKNPQILVLDEATSALDNKTELEIQNSIEQLSKGRTSIIIAHRLTTIENCDMIYVLSDEGIVESGTHQELMQLQSSYYDMYTSAIKSGQSMITE